MLNPVAMSIIRNVFTDARERAQAIGMWGATVGVSLALGPVLGGVLVQSVGWRSIFWINIPVGLLALVLTMRFVPESRAPRPRRLDPVGQLLVIALLASLTYAIIEGPAAGWLSAQSLALLDARRREPDRAARLRAAPRRAADRAALLRQRAVRRRQCDGRARVRRRSAAFLFLNTLYLQELRGFSALRAGLYTLPVAAMTLFFAPLSGRLVGRRGPRVSLLVGGLGILVGGALMTGIARRQLARRAAAGLRDLRARLRHDQPADHQHGRRRHALGAGRRGGRGRLDLAQVGQTLGVAIAGAIAAAGARSVGAHFLTASQAGWWLVAGCGADDRRARLLQHDRRRESERPARRA